MTGKRYIKKAVKVLMFVIRMVRRTENLGESYSPNATVKISNDCN